MSSYEHEDVYNMVETGLYFKAYHNETLAQRKVKGQNLQKEDVTLTLVVDSTWIDKLKLLMICTPKQPRCFGRWHPHKYVMSGTQMKTAWT